MRLPRSLIPRKVVEPPVLGLEVPRYFPSLALLPVRVPPASPAEYASSVAFPCPWSPCRPVVAPRGPAPARGLQLKGRGFLDDVGTPVDDARRRPGCQRAARGFLGHRLGDPRHF